MFSATMPKEVRRLADTYLTRPEQVEVARPASTVENVEQILVDVADSPAAKRQTLRDQLDADDVRNAIIFCNRKRDVTIVNRSLRQHGYNASELHGDMQQSIRTETLERFKKGDISLLVASDVAARGLDVDNMSHVFNFDVPIHADDYVHRIGRTGRAGRPGKAITLAARADAKYIAAIERLTGVKLQRPGSDSTPQAAAAPQETTEVDDQAPAEQDAPAPRSRRRRSRKPREDAATTESAPQAAPQPAPEPAPEPKPEPEPEPEVVEAEAPPSRPRRERRPRNDRQRDERPGRRREDDAPANRDGGDIIGMGDHTPAFLLR